MGSRTGRQYIEALNNSSRDIQVHGEHVYYVGQSGVLVHNSKGSHNLKLNIFGEREAPAFLDVSPERAFANGRPLTQTLPSNSAKEILIRDSPLIGR
jgi:hypothetical protein